MKIYKHLCSQIAGVLAGLVLALLSSQAFGALAGSAHDFTDSLGGDLDAWAGGVTELCVFCHAPHNPAGAADGPLWNHTLSSELAYAMYADPSGTIDGVIATQPAGASKLCLSCHDGTVALDAYGGAAGTATSKMSLIAGFSAFNVGTNLADDHPISVTYADPALAPMLTTDVTIGDTVQITGKIGDLLVPSGSVECSSCHDVHNKYAFATSLLKMDMAASELCQACHAK